MDLTPLLIWWLITLSLGLVGWPLAFSLLRHLPDRGFAFARPVALLLAGYILWLGGTFRLLQNNVGGVLAALGLVLAIGLIWRRQQARAGDDLSLLAWLKREWRYALAVEALFHLALVGWTLFKAYNPQIETAGGEKWMEIAFINSILRSDYFPPPDPWLSGFAISYYYFGYVLMAMLTRLSGLVPVIAFNLYIPTLLAMTLTGALGIVANLVSLYTNSKLPFASILTGLIGAVFVAILGNYDGLLEVLHKRGFLSAGFWRWLDIINLKESPPGAEGRWLPPDLGSAGLSAWIPDRFIWWWRGSRIIADYSLTGQQQEMIDEFPFFSFMLGDVHPHVLALPFVLLVIALALNLLANTGPGKGREAKRREIKSRGETRSGEEETGEGFFVTMLDRVKDILGDAWRELTEAVGGRLAFALYAVYLGGLSFLNTWDFPIYLSLVGLAFMLWLNQRRQPVWQTGILGAGLLGAAGMALYVPFYATFQSQAKGILPNLWNPTRLPQYAVFFGPFLVAAVVLLLVLSFKYQDWFKNMSWSLPCFILGPVLALLAIAGGMLYSPAGRSYVEGILADPAVQQALGVNTVLGLVQVSLGRRVANPWTFLFVGGLVAWIIALLVSQTAKQQTSEPTLLQTDKSTNFPTSYSLIPNPYYIKFVLLLLLIGLGLTLFVEFFYLRDNFGIRMNTIFKFYFQAWVLLALASACAVYYVSQNLRGVAAAAWQVSMTLLVAGGLVYPALATPNKADYFQGKPTLNGIAWIADQHPADYAAIAWLRTHAPAGAVILEAPGAKYAAYQYTSRISAMTGLPTLLGWGGHQSQWRGNYDEPARREPDIEQLYNTLDLRQTQLLLDKYNITYVYVGALERERYTPRGLQKFGLLLDAVFEQDEVTIYQRR